jgi:hypothetical protein
MLFMVIEKYRDGDPKPVYRRFKEKGRMCPQGARYLSATTECCSTSGWPTGTTSSTSRSFRSLPPKKQLQPLRLTFSCGLPARN